MRVFWIKRFKKRVVSGSKKRGKIVRGVGSSHRGYSIFFGKFFKKTTIFAGHNANFRKIPIFDWLSTLWPTHPDCVSKTDFRMFLESITLIRGRSVRQGSQTERDLIGVKRRRKRKDAVWRENKSSAPCTLGASLQPTLRVT